MHVAGRPGVDPQGDGVADHLGAKAGIVCKLNVRVTDVVVMNPVGDMYNSQKSLQNNSWLGLALLSRFDLIFPMLSQAECWSD